MARNFLTISLLAAMGLSICSGCKGINAHIMDQASKEDTAVLCVGMEVSKKYGSCPGAAVDATRMFGLLTKRGKYAESKNATLLISQQATKAAVVAKMREACKKDLAIVFYSGHGGDQKQSAATKQNFVEPTGKDQFLCLYDGPMLDDEVWSVICGAKGRVVLIFDCCHSGTMFRAAPGDGEASTAPFSVARPMARSEDEAEKDAKRSPRMLAISGCPDSSYSYGDASGGLLTKALLDSWREDRTYERVWSILHRNKALNEAEQVQFSEVGKSFKDYMVFK